MIQFKSIRRQLREAVRDSLCSWEKKGGIYVPSVLRNPLRMSPGYPCCCEDESPSSPVSPSPLSPSLSSPISGSLISPSLSTWDITQLLCCDINNPPSTAYLEVNGITNGTCDACDGLGLFTLSNNERDYYDPGRECTWYVYWFFPTGNICGYTVNANVRLYCCDRNVEPGEKYYIITANVTVEFQSITFGKSFQSNSDFTSFSEYLPCTDSDFGTRCGYSGGPAWVHW